MKKTENKYFVSVIIPTLDRAQVLKDSVDDLLALSYEKFEIIIVDQTDHQKPSIVSYFKKNKKIKYIHITKKSSPHARNVGVKYAKGDIVLFLDDDIRINDKKFIDYHIQNFKNKKIGLVGGKVVSEFNQKDPGHKEVGKIKYFGLKEVPNFDANTKMFIDHAPGGNMSVYKHIYNQVGGYQEIYKGNAHLEETDFSIRVKRAGYKLIFEPKAVIKHLAYKTGGNRVRDIYELRYWLVHNYIVFYLKNYPKIFFPILFIIKYMWAVFSGIKRKEYKMYCTMSSAIFDGIKYYNTIK